MKGTTMTHEEWWNEIGSGMPPRIGEDAHEHVRRVTAVCWPAARAAIYEAEAAQLTAPTRIDAARYRWLRSWKRTADYKVSRWIAGEGRYDPLPQEGGLDAAIDADMALTPNV